MTSTADRAAMIARRRINEGLPAFRCPNCAQWGQHWRPDSLLAGRGYFTCGDRGTTEGVEQLTFNLGLEVDSNEGANRP